MQQALEPGRAGPSVERRSQAKISHPRQSTASARQLHAPRENLLGNDITHTGALTHRQSAALFERVGDAALQVTERHDTAQVGAKVYQRLGDLGADARQHDVRSKQLHRLGRA